jgi:CheY-like chemotaxis protein
MLVDDEPYNLLVLSTLMKQFGQATIQANNGLECVNIFKKRLQVSQFNNHKCGILKAIIMDYQMPQMNGR